MQQLIAAQKVADVELAKARDALTAAQADPTKAELGSAQRVFAEKESAKRAADAKCLATKSGNVRRTMLLFGVGFLVVVTLLAQFLEPPPFGYKPIDPAAGGAAAAAQPVAAVDVSPGEMLRTPLFYLLWVMFACGSGAGLMIIANITTIAKIGKIEAGFILVALLAVGNASGRVIAGMLSDKIGRLWTMCIIFLFQAVLMLVLRAGLSDMVAFIVVSMLLGFNYGACLSVFPSATKDNFGLRNFGVNYGLVFTSWGVGGLVFPLVAGAVFEAAKKATGSGNYDNAYLIAAAVLVLAALLTFVTRSAEKNFKMSVSGARVE